MIFKFAYQVYVGLVNAKVFLRDKIILAPEFSTDNFLEET